MCKHNKINSILMTVIMALIFVSCSEDVQEPVSKENKSTALKARVIYGDDDRLDLYQVKDQALKKLADGTVALMKKSNLSRNGNGFDLPVNTFKQSYGLCDSERFGEQPTAAFCSGFLVDDETIVTAGHCIDSSDCNDTVFVFNYGIQVSGVMPYQAREEDVYSCKKVIHSQASSADYAVIKLDRKVLNHTPVMLRRQGVPAAGVDLTVIGHPVGLPTKVAGGAQVRSVNADYMIASLDTYGGNSGSAVFNSKTLEVEGILVRGEYDFEYQGSCTVSHRCTQSGCRGEDVTRISKVWPYLKK